MGGCLDGFGGGAGGEDYGQVVVGWASEEEVGEEAAAEGEAEAADSCSGGLAPGREWGGTRRGVLTCWLRL